MSTPQTRCAPSSSFHRPSLDARILAPAARHESGFMPEAIMLMSQRGSIALVCLSPRCSHAATSNPAQGTSCVLVKMVRNSQEPRPATFICPQVPTFPAVMSAASAPMVRRSSRRAARRRCSGGVVLVDIGAQAAAFIAFTAMNIEAATVQV